MKNVLISFSFTVNKLLINNLYKYILYLWYIINRREQPGSKFMRVMKAFNLFCYTVLQKDRFNMSNVPIQLQSQQNCYPTPWAICQNYSSFPLSGFPGGSDGKASACNAGDPGLIPGWGSSLGEGNGNPLHYSCLENSMDWDW